MKNHPIIPTTACHYDFGALRFSACGPPKKWHNRVKCLEHLEWNK